MNNAALMTAMLCGSRVLEQLVDLHRGYDDLLGLGLIVLHRSEDYVNFVDYLPYVDGETGYGQPFERLRAQAVEAMATHAMSAAAMRPPSIETMEDDLWMMPDGEALWTVSFGDFVVGCTGSANDEWDLDAATVIASLSQTCVTPDVRLVYDDESLAENAMLRRFHEAAYRALRQLELIPPNALVIPTGALHVRKPRYRAGLSSCVGG